MRMKLKVCELSETENENQIYMWLKSGLSISRAANFNKSRQVTNVTGSHGLLNYR